MNLEKISYQIPVPEPSPKCRFFLKLRGLAINFLDSDGLPIPSVVCYEGTKTIVGAAAKQRLGDAGLGIKGNVVRSPKEALNKSKCLAVASTQPVWEATAGRFKRVANRPPAVLLPVAPMFRSAGRISP
jgi:hypothetical protein